MTPKKKSPGAEDVDSELMGLALAEGAHGHPSPEPARGGHRRERARGDCRRAP